MSGALNVWRFCMAIWVVVSDVAICNLYLGWLNPLFHMFQVSWAHQPAILRQVAIDQGRNPALFTAPKQIVQLAPGGFLPRPVSMDKRRETIYQQRLTISIWFVLWSFSANSSMIFRRNVCFSWVLCVPSGDPQAAQLKHFMSPDPRWLLASGKCFGHWSSSREIAWDPLWRDVVNSSLRWGHLPDFSEPT